MLHLIQFHLRGLIFFLMSLEKVSLVLWNVVKYYSYIHVVTHYLIPLRVVVCQGDSMEPTITNNDILICETKSVERNRLKE